MIMHNLKQNTLQRIAAAAFAFLLSAPLFAISKPKPPASKTSASARRAVDELNRKETDSCMKMDHAASAALWADDGVDLIQGLAPMVGKEAISKWYESLSPMEHGAKMESCTIDWQKISIQGDWAWEWGINKQKIDFPAPQKPFESEGKIMLVLKRQVSGEWKIELESWNSMPRPQQAQ